MIKQFSVIAAVAALAAVSGVAQARAVTAPAFSKGEVAIGSIALMPPQAEMLKRKVGADDSMIDESRVLEEAAVENAVAMLEEKGYRVLTLTAADIAADSELQELVRRANDRFDEVYAKVAKRPGQIRRNRYTLGEEAQLLADYLDVDAIAFERIVMEVAAPGQMAMALLIGGSSGGSVLGFTLIHGADGNVLGFYDAALGLIGEERAAQNAANMIRKLSKRAIGKIPESTGEAGVAADDSEEETLDEIEALLEED